MELKGIATAVIFFHLFLVIAGNDVITFNSEDDRSVEDDIDTLLEKEEFIQVEHRRHHQPTNPKPKTFNNASLGPFPPGNLRMPSDAITSSNLLLVPQEQNHVSSSKISSPISGVSAAESKKTSKNMQWEELTEMIREEEIDDMLMNGEEIYLPSQGESLGPSLFRARRSLEAMSGEICSNITVIMNIPLSADQATDGSEANTQLKSDLATAWDSYLMQKINGIAFRVEVDSLTPSGNNAIVDLCICYDEELSLSEIAMVLIKLENDVNGFKLNGQLFSVTSPELDSRAAICYTCETYQKCELVNSNWMCLLTDPRFYPHGATENDLELDRDSEFTSAQLDIDEGVTFGEESIDSLYISVNGYISLGENFTSFEPETLPVGDRKLLAVYWSDLDLISDIEGAESHVYYHMYTKENNRGSQVLRRANADVVGYSGRSSFDATTVIVATWVALPPWPGQDNLLERTSFQAVIITDGETSYVLYIYGQGAMNFNPSNRYSVVVGYNSTNFDTSVENYYIFDEILGNTGERGLWFSKLGELFTGRAMCLQFFYNSLPLYQAIVFWNRVIPACPCSRFGAEISPFWLRSFEEPDCYDIFPIFGQIGRRCCYRGFAFENRMPDAGNFQLFTPYFFDLENHERFDTLPKQYCCEDSNFCNLYYLLRPTRRCSSRGFFRAFFFGDPHITTLDQRTFIFNGLGEYRLLEIEGVFDNVTTNFKLQGRTCQAEGSDGNLTSATVWCALAVSNTNGTSLHVNIHQSGNYMVIYLNGQDFTARFRDNSTFSTNNDGMFLENENGSLRLYTPDGIGFTVTLANGLLDFPLSVDAKFRNGTTGLLGNFNGDSTDDFIFPNGTTLPDNSSERVLFEYGKTWEIETSLFRYFPGESQEGFSKPDFEPLFLDEQNETVRATAEQVCGNPNDLPCIFDYFVTGRQDIALATRDGVASYETTETTLNNQAPTLTQNVTLQVVVGQTENFSLTASDPDSDPFEYRVIEGNNSFTYNMAGDDFIGSFTPRDTDKVEIGIVAVDNKGVESEVSEISIITCSGCNSNGTCNYDRPRETLSPYYSIASCDCKQAYTGLDCEADKNGCDPNLCPTGTTCTDAPAAQEDIDGIPYTCSDCPAGSFLANNGTKCQDIDECTTQTKPCGDNAVCMNTRGSFICTCNAGYRKSSSGVCEDINECVENQNQCEQICVNEIGSYSCDCRDGYELWGMDSFTFNCTNSSDPCDKFSSRPNCQFGCQNVSGSPECFCPIGEQLSADNISCEDVNECEENLCAQGCNNTKGSYFCSCYAGFTLNIDKLSCDPCPENQYGENCGKICSCSGRSDGCDSVKGCLCQPEWTGENCEIDVNECDLDPTICNSDELICVNTNGSYACECPTGFTKDNNNTCQDIDECEKVTSNECPRISRCVNNPGSYTCVCNEGYISENQTTCKDINECDAGSSGCEQECENVLGSFNCQCRLGYVLADNRLNCTFDTDPCSGFSTNCSYACDLKDGAPECYCQLGFRIATDGTSCIDDNECARDNACSDTCVNTEGSFKCSCPNGKKLDNDRRTCQVCDEYHWGPDCANECACNPLGFDTCNPEVGCICKEGWAGTTCQDDVNECAVSPSPCSNNSECVNSPGSFRCRCRSGYQLDTNTNTCKDIDECDSSPCDHRCENTEGSYNCSCFSEGFLKEGDKCTDINECLVPELHNCDQNCRNTQGGFACECFPGYVLDVNTRKTCNEVSSSAAACDPSNSCSDFCSNFNGTVVCSCPTGKQLGADNITCEDINECDVQPCNNGNCTDGNGTFSCSCSVGFRLASDLVTCEVCTNGYYGVDCNETCSCITANTETCNPVDGSCTCREGWNGSICNTPVDECDSVDCGPNSRCENTPGSFQCICDIGFYRTATSCVECDSTSFGQNCAQTCNCSLENTQLCNKTTGECVCNSGWQGTNCETDINECDNSTYCTGPFEKCVNQNGSAECACITGYHRPNPGDQCEDIKECMDPLLNNCLEPSICNNTAGSFECYCPDGYTENATGCQDINECGDNQLFNCSGENEVCNNTAGGYECVCGAGFQRENGTCSDVNECLDNALFSCEAPKRCNNTIGNYTCYCPAGYLTANDGSCIDIIECNDTQLFNCGENEVCNNTVGGHECVCATGYQRENDACVDVDECQDPALNKCVEPKVCNNTDGSFRCDCGAGYLPQADGSCLDNSQGYRVRITLAFTKTFDSDIFTNTTDEFNELAAAVEESLLDYGRNEIGLSIATVTVIRFINGSVIADTLVRINEAFTNNPPGDAARLVHSLNEEDSIPFNGSSTVNITSVAVGSDPVDVSASMCDVFDKFENCSEVAENQECQVVGGTPQCAPIDSDDSNYDLIIGLGVGIPLFVLLTLTIALLVCLYVRRKGKHTDPSSAASVDRDTPFPKSIFAPVAPMRSWGPQRATPMYAPDLYSETGTSDSSRNSQLLKSKQRLRPDFQDSPWYEPSRGGATPRDVAESRGAPTDAAGPTSNFSWEYMFKILEPHRGFEIQRPNLNPSPNPAFTPRNKRPDSMA